MSCSTEEQTCCNPEKNNILSKIKRYITNYIKKKKWYSILSDVVFIVFVALLIIPSTRTDVASFFIRLTSLPPSTLDVDEQINISNESKNWTVFDMNGDPVSLASLNSKPIFLNFWATWCPPCIAELPSIKELHGMYGDDVNFVLVSNESRAKVRAFVADRNMESLPFYQNKATPQEFARQSIPTTFIIDRNGKIVLSKEGVAKWNSGKVEKLLERLIKDN